MIYLHFKRLFKERRGILKTFSMKLGIGFFGFVQVRDRKGQKGKREEDGKENLFYFF